MKGHYLDLGSASDWLNQIFHAARPIRSTTRIWVVTRHQYGISALVSQTSFGGEPVEASPNVVFFFRLLFNWGLLPKRVLLRFPSGFIGIFVELVLCQLIKEIYLVRLLFISRYLILIALMLFIMRKIKCLFERVLTVSSC